jgi:hypothetical protein
MPEPIQQGIMTASSGTVSGTPLTKGEGPDPTPQS